MPPGSPHARPRNRKCQILGKDCGTGPKSGMNPRTLFASMAPMSKQEERDLFEPRHLSQALPKVKPPSRIKQRLIESAVQIEADGPDSILYQHTVFCQTGLPYRDPG